MATIIKAQSGHTMWVGTIDDSNIPVKLDHADAYDLFYVVRNYDNNGVTFMYLGKGNKDAPREVVAWYPNGRMWSSFGKTLAGAIDGAQRDGWMYAK